MIITFQREIVNYVFACYSAFIKTSCPFGKFGGPTITQCSNDARRYSYFLITCRLDIV